MNTMVDKICIIYLRRTPYVDARVSALRRTLNPSLNLSSVILYRDSDESPWWNNLSEMQEWKIIQNNEYDNLLSYLEETKPFLLVLVGYSHTAMRAAAGWARKNGVHSILISDSNYVDRPRRWFKEKLKGYWIKKHFDAAFAGGAKSAEYLERLGVPSNRIWRGCDVVDNDFFYRSSEQIWKNREYYKVKLGLSGNYFLYVGRLSPEKNLRRLLEAYKLYCIEACQKPWNLVMVGSGPQEHELTSLATKLGLNSVKWCGFKQIDELSPYYALASCLILASTSETWGLSVNEAMACKLPVLVSERCGCVPDLVFPGINGYIFDPNRVDEMAFYMKRISSEDIDLESMREASVKIVSNYNPETWAKTLTDCIHVTMLKNINNER